MSYAFSRRQINSITNDLSLFLHEGKGAVGKLDYFTSQASLVEQNGAMEISYVYERFDIIPEIEHAVIGQVERAEEKSIGLQLHLSPASLVVQVDRLFFQQIFFRFFGELIEVSGKQSLIHIYVTDCDGKCVIELMARPQTQAAPVAEDYFRKYRITNAAPAPPAAEENVLPVYKKIVEEMNGELSYVLVKDKPSHVRFKFALA